MVFTQIHDEVFSLFNMWGSPSSWIQVQGKEQGAQELLWLWPQPGVGAKAGAVAAAYPLTSLLCAHCSPTYSPDASSPISPPHKLPLTLVLTPVPFRNMCLLWLQPGLVAAAAQVGTGAVTPTPLCLD